MSEQHECSRPGALPARRQECYWERLSLRGSDMKIHWERLLLVVVAVLLGGCTTSLEDAACPCLPGWCCRDHVCKRDSECNLKIAFIPKASDNPVFRVAFQAARRAADDLKNKFGESRVDVECVSSPYLDLREQDFLVGKEGSSKWDGLIVSCLDPSTITVPIDRAVTSGKPVITYDSDCPDSMRLGFFGMKNFESGQKAADLLAAAMGPGPRSVAIVTGDSAQNLQLRARGFIHQLGSHPEVYVSKIIFCSNENSRDCGRRVDEFIKDHSMLDGLLVTGLWGLEAACKCEGSPPRCSCEGRDDYSMPNWKDAASLGTLKTVAYDALPFALELFNKRFLSALIHQDYSSWGSDSVRSMFEHLTGEKEVKSRYSVFRVFTDKDRDKEEDLPRWSEKDFDPKPSCDTKDSNNAQP